MISTKNYPNINTLPLFEQSNIIWFFLRFSLHRDENFTYQTIYLVFDSFQWVFETKAGQIGITNLQLIDYQYLEILVFLQVVLIYYFLTVSFW